MPKQAESKAVEFSCRVYRRLLLVYPKSHREEYGAAILQLFRDQCRDAWGARRIWGVIGFWLRAIADLLKTSVLEHFSNFNWSRIMLTSFRPTIRPLPAFFGICAAVFLPILVVTVVITLIFPETYASTATVLVSRSADETSKAITASDMGQSDLWFLAEFSIVSSSVVLEKTATNLDLRNVWGKKYNNGQPLQMVDVVALLKNRMEVSMVQPGQRSAGNVTSSFPLHIRVYSDSAEESARLANGVVEGYREFHMEQNRQASVAPPERTVTILDPAVPSYRPVRPNKPLNIVVGALLGLLIGVITAPLVLGLFVWVGKRRSPPAIPQKA